ncbi:uncharacterized protein LOC128859397 [Anastrepha ludens]|uniref:uncharacterized protein LOC128859397 n=1 Tax=Anastrepha ludens TaxID=28586 RepID=UPI0023B10B59|nr:uncharacterized protein LOC128859397 [Anastrepha ludens]
MSFLPTNIGSQFLHFSVVSSFKMRTKGMDVSKLYPNFSDCEIISLQNAWRIIEPKIRRLSKEIPVDLYVTNCELIENFRDQNGKISRYDLINYTYRLLRVYGKVIKCNVDPLQTSKILEPFVKLHSKYSTDIANIKPQLDYIQIHIFSELSSHLSPTTVGSFDKLTKFMLHYFRIRAGSLVD